MRGEPKRVDGKVEYPGWDLPCLIDLPQPLDGYQRFLSCWLVRGQSCCALVDPGPRSSIEHLLRELGRRRVEHIDVILLSHVHLDHGGGSAEVLRAFPMARLYAHPKGRPHLVSPGELWRGSLATIGEVAEAYGEPRPVPEERLTNEAGLERLGLRALPTPGHAAHHSSFLAGRLLLAGEAIATRVPLGNGRHYLRPATPPRFLPEVFFSSLAAIEALEPEPAWTAFAHYGIGRGAREWCRRTRRQLELWLRVAREAAQEDYQRMLSRLLHEDPDFAGLARLSPAEQAREKFYAENSLSGLWQHLHQ